MSIETTHRPLPGRAVDIVYAALRGQGRIGNIQVRFRHHGPDADMAEVSVVPHGPFDEATGRAVFAALGVVHGVALGRRYGSRPGGKADLEGDVPALGTYLSIVIGDLPPLPESSDPAALVAEVDAARAAAEAPADVPAALLPESMRKHLPATDEDDERLEN